MPSPATDRASPRCPHRPPRECAAPMVPLTWPPLPSKPTKRQGTPPPVLKAEHISKRFAGPAGEVNVLADVSLSLERGETAAIMGPSGTGKSTLLYILGALDTPSAGAVSLDGTAYSSLDDRAQAAFRNRH